MMGYGGQTPTIEDTSAFDGTTSTAPSTTSTPTPTTGEGQEYSGGVLGDTLYLRDIQLVGNVYKSDTSTYGSTGLNAYKVNATSTASYYWLASRRFGYYSATYFNFYGRSVYSDGSLSSITFRFFNSSWFDRAGGAFLRPIITLKSGIQITGGSGEKENPYTIG